MVHRAFITLSRFALLLAEDSSVRNASWVIPLSEMAPYGPFLPGEANEIASCTQTVVPLSEVSLFLTSSFKSQFTYSFLFHR